MDPQKKANDWQLVGKNKRNHSPEKCTVKKQTILNDYWLNKPIETENRFQILHEENEPGNTATITSKPPPITIYQVQNITPLQKLLDSLINTRYQISSLGLHKIKLQLENTEDFNSALLALDKNKTEYHTYRPKQEKTYRVIMKGLHPSSDIDFIKDELKKEGHETTNIWNIRHRTSKQPLPMFYLDLKTRDNNKQIYSLKQIGCFKVYFEPPHAKRTIPQCTNCQNYGHTKNFCRRPPRCVKCTRPHSTSDCPRKDKDDGVQCVNCNENHPANYRGCIIHKQLQEKLYPQLRQKTVSRDLEKPEAPIQTPISPSPQPNIQHLPQITKSYADTLRTNSPTTQHITPPLTNSTIPNNPNNDITELKTLIKELIEQNRENSKQMGTMLNLLTSLVNKISNGSTH